jgi:hypothetical protein
MPAVAIAEAGSAEAMVAPAPEVVTGDPARRRDPRPMVEVRAVPAGARQLNG